MLPTANNQFSLDNIQQLFNQQKIIGGPDLSKLLGNLGIPYPTSDLAGEASGSELSNIGGGPLAMPNLSGIDATKNKALVDLLTNPGNWQQIQQYDLGAGQPASNYFQYTGPTSAQNQGPQAAALPQTIAPTWLPTPSQLYGMQPQAPGTAITSPTGNLAYQETALTPTTPGIMGPLDVTVQPPGAPQPGQPPVQQPGQQLGQQPGQLGQATAQPQPNGATWQNNLESSFFSLARVPRFQEGGIVTQPTVAMVGEDGPEAIVPLGDNYGYDFLSNPTKGLSRATTFAPLPETASPNTAPAGSEIFHTQAPNYLQTNRSTGAIQQFMKSLSTPDDSIQAPRRYADQPPVTNPTAPDNKDYGYGQTKQYLQHGEEFANAADRVVGNGTTFGLNYDGSADPMDTGKESAFGYNTADKTLEGASLPVSVIKNSIGDYANNPEIRDAIKRGDYKVAVTNADGSVTKVVPIVDAGPAEWTGNSIDLSYRTSHDLNTNGKAKVGYRIIGPDGDTVPVRGYHPQSTANVNWDDHIGSNRQGVTQEQTDTAIKESLARNQWASTEVGIPAGYKPPANPIGIPDFFRKRGDQPITSQDDPRLQPIKVGDQSWNVNKEAAPYFQGFLNDLQKAGAPTRSDGGWAYREKVGASGISEHAYGGAIDVNQNGRNEVTPEFQEWMKNNPDTLAQLEKKWNIYGGEKFGDLGHFEWGGVPIPGITMKETGDQGTQVAKAAPEVPETKEKEKAPEEEEEAPQRKAGDLGAKLAQLAAQERTMIQPGKTQAVLGTMKQKPVVRTPEEMPAFA